MKESDTINDLKKEIAILTKDRDRWKRNSEDNVIYKNSIIDRIVKERDSYKEEVKQAICNHFDHEYEECCGCNDCRFIEVIGANK